MVTIRGLGWVEFDLKKWFGFFFNLKISSTFWHVKFICSASSGRIFLGYFVLIVQNSY